MSKVEWSHRTKQKNFAETWLKDKAQNIKALRYMTDSFKKLSHKFFISICLEISLVCWFGRSSFCCCFWLAAELSLFMFCKWHLGFEHMGILDGNKMQGKWILQSYAILWNRLTSKYIYSSNLQQCISLQINLTKNHNLWHKQTRENSKCILVKLHSNNPRRANVHEINKT